ncbi:D-glycerate dehydrogenase [Candidatus Peregrinibacteria bacterium CG_4_9_14_0_2_um_filter_53_11]|nr:MAG: D-glycerate dehydrogenase [Candidatus Peregrinibacteria bacterium CG_4_9_14_0_2_um_filter_53_11]
MANIYVTREIPEGGLKLLREKFGEFEMNTEDRVLSRAELLEKVRGRDAVLSLLTDTIDAEVFDAAGPQCKIFSNYAVGFNNIDLAAASERGIMVTNTPGVLTEATADLAIALMFACARSIVEADEFMRGGKFQGWGPMMFLGQEVTGQTLGIVGAGRIGYNVALKMAKGFGMKILYVDMSQQEELERETGARRVELDELLRESDFVSLHVTLNPSTEHMINAEKLALMKPTAILVNTARGPVVDEKALVEALQQKKIFAAGLDVFENEPAMAPGLAELKNAIVVPHIASATMWTRTQMAEIAARNLISALEGRTPEFLVNAEQLGKA